MFKTGLRLAPLNKKNFVQNVKDIGFPVKVMHDFTKLNISKMQRMSKQNGGWEPWLQSEYKDILEQQTAKDPGFGPGFMVERELPIWNALNAAKKAFEGMKPTGTTSKGDGKVDIFLGPNEHFKPTTGKIPLSTLIELKVAYRRLEGLGTIDGELKSQKVLVKDRFVEDIEKLKRDLNGRGMALTFGTSKDVLFMGLTEYPEELDGDWGEFGDQIKWMEIKGEKEELFYLLWLEATLNNEKL